MPPAECHAAARADNTQPETSQKNKSDTSMECETDTQSMKREEPIALTNARNALNNPHKIPLNIQKTAKIISGLRSEVRKEAGTAPT